MATKAQLLTALSGHIGKGRGITARHLAGRIDSPERNVRLLVTELRSDGVAVCGTPRDGYYIAETAEELEETCNFLRGRAMCSLVIEATLRKVPLADLLGQLKLPT